MLYRCMAILKHVSGFPRDNVTNTFHFLTAEPPGVYGLAESVAELVRDFYVTHPGEQTLEVMQYLGPTIVNLGHEVRVYPVTEATGVDPRGKGSPPLHTEVFDLIGRVAPTAGTATEVAACLSYRNNLSSNVPPAQRRGRVYIGPLEASVVGVRAGTVIPAPTDAFQVNLRYAGMQLRDQVAVAADWVVYSRPFAGRPETPRPNRTTLPELAARPGAPYVVTQVWTDDALDTQRRRGERPTAKTFS